MSAVTTRGYVIRPLAEDDREAVQEFECRERALADWLRKWGYFNDLNGISAVSVCVRTGEADPALPRLLGYCTRSAASLPTEVIQQLVAFRLPRYAPGIPLMLIGRLAVHRDAEGRGIGTALLREALRSSLGERTHAGVLVEALGEDAARWYERFKFRRLEPGGLQLLLPLDDLRAVLS